MNLPLVPSKPCSCEYSKEVDTTLPSLDDYNQTGLTITYLPSPRSYIGLETG